MRLCHGGYLGAQKVRNLPAMQETWFWSLAWEDPLEKGMANHSSILAWRIPWTEECGWLQSMGAQRIGHNWATNTFFHLGHKGGAHMMGLVSSQEKPSGRKIFLLSFSLSLFQPTEDTTRKLSEIALTRTQPCWHADFRLPAFSTVKKLIYVV